MLYLVQFIRNYETEIINLNYNEFIENFIELLSIIIFYYFLLFLILLLYQIKLLINVLIIIIIF
jgi:hypothetical protein